MKTIWLSSLVSRESTIKKVFTQVQPYGLEMKGTPWEDNLDKAAWTGVRGELIKPEVSLWLILASPENLDAPSIRYGLSLLSITVQAKRGLSFPILILMTGGDAPPADTLPTPLKGADFLSLEDPGMAAKLVAKVHAPVKEIDSEYRLDAYGNPQTGQWFEIGPRHESWSGAMFGVSEGEITFHGVGPKGRLPSHSTLEYPSKGLKLEMGEKEYTAWAVKNEIDSGTSYFVKVEGFPDSIIFSPFSPDEETEVFVLSIK